MIRSRETRNRQRLWGANGIGRVRKAGRRTASPVERFDPEGCKSPGGEWRLEETQVGRPETLQRARSNEAAGDRGEPGPVAERKGRTGRETGWSRCEVTGQER